MQNHENDPYQPQRQRMVEQQIRERGVKDLRVLQAMLAVPRHEFVANEYKRDAYDDSPLPIAAGQTISQPYIVAFMSEQLQLSPGERVLEIGSGCGYQAAVLAELTDQVYSIEILPPLCKIAAENLKRLNYNHVNLRCGDGYQGWPEAAPFDAIIVTAAPDHIPQPLLDQLAPGGRMIIPVGSFFQELITITKTENGFVKKRVLPVRFVPMTGEAEEQR